MSQGIEVPIQPACRSSVEAVCRICRAQGSRLMDFAYSEDGEKVILFFAPARAKKRVARGSSPRVEPPM